MKLVAVRPGPRFSVQDVHHGWVKALTALLGRENVGDFNLDDRLDFYDKALQAQPGEHTFLSTMRMACKGLEAAVYEFWPDVILVTSGFFVPPDLLQLFQARGHKVVLLATESPYEEDHQLGLAPYCDLVILNDPTHLDLYTQITKAVYIPHAYDPDVHKKPAVILPEWRSDFCFVGTGYPSRVEFLERVDWTGIDVALGGNWQHVQPGSPIEPFIAHPKKFCLDNADAVNLYAGTKCSANIYRREAQRPELSEGWAMGPREVELAAVGCFYLTEERGENREVLPMLPTFVGPDDFGEKLRWWLAHDSERERVALAAQRAIADRTFVSNARDLLGLIG